MGIYDELARLDDKPASPPRLGKSSIAKIDKALDGKGTRKVTQTTGLPRNITSENLREKSREFPTRDEIQEFSFRMRDELKVKVQAEVPHAWQGELEEIARRLKVKKLELYRFVLGEFLGKVRRKLVT